MMIDDDDDVIVDEELERQVKVILQMLDSSVASTHQRQQQLQLALTAVEKIELDLRQNIELLKSIRDRGALRDVLSTNISLLKNSRDELAVKMHTLTHTHTHTHTHTFLTTQLPP